MYVSERDNKGKMSNPNPYQPNAQPPNPSGQYGQPYPDGQGGQQALARENFLVKFLLFVMKCDVIVYARLSVLF